MSLWVESHLSRARHPKTRALMREASMSRVEALGTLDLLWWWAMEFTPDGNITRYIYEVEQECDWKGDEGQLIRALVNSGWVDGNPDIRSGGTYHIHDWDHYAGKLLARKRANADRMKEARSGHVQDTCDARAEHVSSERRGEESTEQKKRTPSSGDVEGFDEWYAKYPRKTAKQHARAMWKKLTPEDRANALEALPRYVAFVAGKDFDKIAHPGTWLNGRRWEDQLPTPITAAKSATPHEKTYPIHETLSDGSPRFVHNGRYLEDRAAL